MAALIRVDRNGTKYYEGYVTCDRCGGNGGSDAWKFTGWTCYKCGGEGRVLATWKEYTPEYEAKLTARREKKNAAFRAQQEAELAKIEAERKAREEAEKAEQERIEREIAERKARSQYVGEEGEKLTLAVTYLGSPHFTTRLGGWMEQTTYIHSFYDDAGNKIVWKSGTFPVALQEAEEGQRMTITGTVKAHSEYKEEKQTALTRCKII